MIAEPNQQQQQQLESLDSDRDRDREQALVESVYNQSKYWLIDNANQKLLNKQFLGCMQTANLRNNFIYWDEKSKLKQQISINQSTLEEDDSEDNNTSW